VDSGLVLWVNADLVSASFAGAGLAEPASDYCVLTWIQRHLAGSGGSEFPTLSSLYTTATGDPLSGRLRRQLWASLTPRTVMFEKFFSRLGPSTNHYEAVVAMHECGFTPQVLESLPEAVLTPLQDAISICQPSPPPSWPKGLLTLVGRTDMSGVLQPHKTGRALASAVSVSTANVGIPGLRATTNLLPGTFA
jgi:anaphase-promoting complex subunit 1